MAKEIHKNKKDAHAFSPLILITMTSIGQMDPTLQPLSINPVYIDPFLAPRPPHVPFGCTVCGGIDNEDKILVCDKNCGRESHIYCLRPPLQDIPEGEWFCEACDPQGSTKHLEAYLDKVEQWRLQISLQSPVDYEVYIQSNVVPLEDLHRLYESTSYMNEFDVQDAQLVGHKVRVFCEGDGRYHLGRIIGRRKNEMIGQVEHLVLFKRYGNLVHNTYHTSLLA
ncbi:hypothetical protein EON65_37960 [archaeon]|nr:MAG: hypothetical protein EON65_37960 [archaeon]